MQAPRRLQLRRGNTSSISSYVGAAGEVVVNIDDWSLYVHDGSTVGGHVITGGGVGTLYSNSNVKSYLSSFNGNILPSANVTYSLGNSTHQWKDLWVSNNTIYINSIPLSINNNGNLLINGNEIAQGAQGIQGEIGPQGPRGNIGPQGPQGNVGPTGPQGIQGIQGNTGPQGAQGIQGNVGATGPQGAQGIQGIQGNTGPQGAQGIQGNVGATGAQGPQGIQGIQGNVGEQGPRGFTGNTGEQGPQGERGLTGNTGAQGVSVTLLGSVDFVANLPITANVGEGWIVQADGDLYLWNTISSVWNNIGQIVGPQGDAGPQGPRGFTGNIGPEGPQGIQGNVGPQGEQGIQGNVGPQGERGIQGNVGSQGPQGEQGEQGIQGNTGPQGERGLQGNVGPQGATGATGAQGPQGNAGVNGTNGQDGVGISNATVTSGNLVITLTDDTIINAGNVVGPQGPRGERGEAGGAANLGDLFVTDSDINSDTSQNFLNLDVEGEGWMRLGTAEDDQKLQLITGFYGNTQVWEFGTDGNLVLPQTGMMSSPAPTSWPGITFSDGTFQNTAANGFKSWIVDGEDSLVADSNDSVEIVAGTGVIITTNNTAPKSLTISADSLVNLDGGSAGTVFDTPVVYADGGGASTRFGVNSVVFDGENITPGTIDFNLNGGRA